MTRRSSRAALGRRIHVIGNSCSGKSTLGRRLADALRVPFVEIDALNWQPGWVGLNDTDPAELDRRLRAATVGEGFVVAGSYLRFSRRAFWPRLDTVVWLDPPLPLLLKRVVARSWRRWRSGELLWGTNREPFWPQFALWRKEESLIWWIATQHGRKRRTLRRSMRDPRWTHIRFLRLASPERVEAFARGVEASAQNSSEIRRPQPP